MSSGVVKYSTEDLDSYNGCWLAYATKHIKISANGSCLRDSVNRKFLLGFCYFYRYYFAASFFSTILFTFVRIKNNIYCLFNRFIDYHSCRLLFCSRVFFHWRIPLTPPKCYLLWQQKACCSQFIILFTILSPRFVHYEKKRAHTPLMTLIQLTRLSSNVYLIEVWCFFTVIIIFMKYCLIDVFELLQSGYW